MMSHWPCFTWKFFMIWFHNILKFFRCSHHVLEIYVLNTEENYLTWQLSRKFSYTLGTTIVQNMKFSHCNLLIWFSWIFEFLFWFSSAILLSKMKSLFFGLWTQIFHVIFESPSQFFFKFCIIRQSHKAWLLCIFLTEILYTFNPKRLSKYKFG